MEERLKRVINFNNSIFTIDFLLVVVMFKWKTRGMLKEWISMFS